MGCGSGEETEFLLTKKPAELFGVDISEQLIAIAKKEYPKVHFSVMDAENLIFPDNRFDFVYSSLLIDYFESWVKILSEVRRVLVPNGIFLLSDLHPVKWAGEKLNDADGKATGSLIGYNKDPETGKQVIYGDYLNTVMHSEIWMKQMEVSSYTRPISKMFRELTAGGFSVLDILEPKAVEETKKYDIDYWEVNQKIPNFIIFECQKI